MPRVDQALLAVPIAAAHGGDPDRGEARDRSAGEGLNDLIQAGTPHPLQSRILDALFAAEEAHRAELAYWMDTSDPDADNWWPIASALVTHQRERS